MNLLKKIWNDPVWSNVIAYIICNGITIPIMSIFNLSTSIYWIASIIVAIVMWRCFMRFKKHYYDDKAKEADKKLFVKIMEETLPISYMHGFFRNFDFGNPFPFERLKPISEVVSSTKDTRFEFLNPRLEKKKKRLFEDVKRFDHLLSPHIFSVPPNHDLFQISPFHIEEDPMLVPKINQMATQVTNDYDDFIRTGRKIFKI